MNKTNKEKGDFILLYHSNVNNHKKPLQTINYQEIGKPEEMNKFIDSHSAPRLNKKIQEIYNEQ